MKNMKQVQKRSIKDGSKNKEMYDGQVMARQYRPEKFAQVIGQRTITQTLQNAFSQGQLGHAYLLHGARGVGKTSLARIISRLVNCEDLSAEMEPCNRCSACQEILSEKAMDVLEIDAASHRGIQHIRELRENVQFQPMHLKKKVYIIDEVHMLTLESFNALLKTLEEPPSYSMFILVTTEIQKIPLTILSRCQTLNLKNIEMADLEKTLYALCKKLKREIEKEAVLAIVRHAKGSMRDMLSFFEQVYYFSQSKIRLTDVEKLLGIIPESLIFNLVKELFSKKSHGEKRQDREKTSQQTMENNEDPVALWQLSEYLRSRPSVDFFFRFLWQLINFLRILLYLKRDLKTIDYLGITKEQAIQYHQAFKEVYPEQIQLCARHFYELLIQSRNLPLDSHLELSVLIELEFMQLKDKLRRPTLANILSKLLASAKENEGNEEYESTPTTKQEINQGQKKKIETSKVDSTKNRTDSKKSILQEKDTLAEKNSQTTSSSSMEYELQKTFQGTVLHKNRADLKENGGGN